MFYKLWKGYAFDVTYLKVWGCLAKVLFPKSKKWKLGPKTFDGVFIGYVENRVYMFLVIISEHNLVEVNMIIETKTVDFFRTYFLWILVVKNKFREQLEMGLINLLKFN